MRKHGIYCLFSRFMPFIRIHFDCHHNLFIRVLRSCGSVVVELLLYCIGSVTLCFDFVLSCIT